MFHTGLTKSRHFELFNKLHGTVISIPSESSGVIVNWDGLPITVSAILPPATRKILARWSKGITTRPAKEAEIKTPTLLITSKYGYYYGENDAVINLSRRFRRNPNSEHIFLLALNEDIKDKILVKPYRISNVYPNTAICWGSENISPRNLREANNTFWSAPFNCDFGGPTHDRTCPEREHNSSNCGALRYVHTHLKVDNTCACVPRGDGIYCDYCNRFYESRITPELQELTDKLDYIDLCSIGKCTERECSCKCACCTDSCGCLCDCDLTDEFIEGLQSFTDGGRFGQRLEFGSPWKGYCPLSGLNWEDWTPTICGPNFRTRPKFFSYAKQCDGIFVSYEDHFVEKFDEDIIKTHNGKKMVIGVFHKERNGATVDFGKKTIRLTDKQYVYIFDQHKTSHQLALERHERDEQHRAEQQRIERERAYAEERRIAVFNIENRHRLSRIETIYHTWNGLPVIGDFWRSYFSHRQNIIFIQPERPVTSIY